MSKDNLGSSLVFFMLGAATGAAIALLYAPQEGEATRKFLADKLFGGGGDFTYESAPSSNGGS